MSSKSADSHGLKWTGLHILRSNLTLGIIRLVVHSLHVFGVFYHRKGLFLLRYSGLIERGFVHCKVNLHPMLSIKQTLNLDTLWCGLRCQSRSRGAGQMFDFDGRSSVWRNDAEASSSLDEIERGLIENNLSVVPCKAKGDLLILEFVELVEEDCRFSGELKKLSVGFRLGNQSVWLAMQGEYQRHPRGRHV